MRIGLSDGFVQPKEIMEFILPSFEVLTKGAPSDHTLYRPFTQMPDTISPGQRKALQRKALQKRSKRKVIPAYAELYSFMVNEYVPNAADFVGAKNLPDGDSYYDALVRFYTTISDADSRKAYTKKE